MAARGMIPEARATGTATIAPQQISRDATFIDKDVPPDIA
jgi:hypothetical protein